MSQKIQSRPTPWATILLSCGKCARKMKGGYGEKRKHPIRSALRGALKDAGHRRDVRVIETGCMGVCPKKAVTVINASHPEKIYVVAAGAPVANVVRIMLDPAATPV